MKEHKTYCKNIVAIESTLGNLRNINYHYSGQLRQAASGCKLCPIKALASEQNSFAADRICIQIGNAFLTTAPVPTSGTLLCVCQSI